MQSDFETDSVRPNIPEYSILIIFGASGDLTRRKLMPGLYHLSRESLLPEYFSVIGIGRRIQLGEEFILHMQNRVRQYCSHDMEGRYWKPLASKMSSIRADYKEEATYETIKQKILSLREEWGNQPNILYYLATSPSHFELIVEKLANHNLHNETGDSWIRLIIEKPFGLDYNSAEQLNSRITKHFTENQIFRIDHFLGKEAVQNILIFRMSNVIFQPLWTREYIDHIQITSAETIGVEGRADYFEQTGAIRDMIQSHLLQILAFLTMDFPQDLNPENIRDEKVKLLKAIRRYSVEEVSKYLVRGQYTEGVVNSELIQKYVDEDGINPQSKVETYAAIKLFIDNYRWRGIPFYLRTGKRMPSRKAEIYIQLKQPEKSEIARIFSHKAPITNSIRLEIQPRAGVDITMGWKSTGILSDIESTQLTIGGKADIAEPKAYERLLVDAMVGDSTLFPRYDEIQELWQIVDPFLKYCEIAKEENIDTLFLYPAGTQGPVEANNFIDGEDNHWTEI